MSSINNIRAEFPIFQRDPSLHFLDSAASSLKPARVVDRLSNYLKYEHANIHRGAYRLSANATDMFDDARVNVAKYLGVSNPEHLVFTKGATESINLAAHTVRHLLNEDDAILISILEHHSNIVPWELVAKDRRASLKFFEVNKDGTFNETLYLDALNKYKPKVVAFTWISNAFGSMFPVGKMVAAAKQIGAITLVDACQAAPHIPLQLDDLRADFVALSGHKMYGPTGIGVLYGSPSIQGKMQPYQSGGDMIESVTIHGSKFAEFPRKFEAGTPPIAEVIGLGEAVKWIQEIGFDTIINHEKQLYKEAHELLSNIRGVNLYSGTNSFSSNVLAFTVDGVHPHDLSSIVDSENVQIRAGHHCAMPAMEFMGVQSTARASLGVYSVIADFEALKKGIIKAQKMFGL